MLVLLARFSTQHIESNMWNCLIISELDKVDVLAGMSLQVGKGSSQ